MLRAPAQRARQGALKRAPPRARCSVGGRVVVPRLLGFGHVQVVGRQLARAQHEVRLEGEPAARGLSQQRAHGRRLLCRGPRRARRVRFQLPVRVDLVLCVQQLPGLLARVGARLEGDHRVERDGHVGRLLSGQPHEVGVHDAEDALVRHDEQGLRAPLHLHDDGLQAVAHVQVGLPARVAVGQLVLLAPLVLVGVLGLDLVVAHAVADARVNLV
mmetsp:Transcript_6315/g.21621  ORF Transcript_6315/g.21621 Transcript_6315/m.21621 type:complete len:215 (+) Transcript_6315:393-1037(+)